jgi:hypothetical protein
MLLFLEKEEILKGTPPVATPAGFVSDNPRGSSGGAGEVETRPAAPGGLDA